MSNKVTITGKVLSKKRKEFVSRAYSTSTWGFMVDSSIGKLYFQSDAAAVQDVVPGDHIEGTFAKVTTKEEGGQVVITFGNRFKLIKCTKKEEIENINNIMDIL